mgnify:CR=1 FL=1
MANESSGDVTESALVAVFERVAAREGVSSLIVSDGVSERIFYFAIGGVRVIRSGPRASASIGRVLLDLGRLGESDLKRILARCRESGELFGATAVQEGAVRSEDVDLAIQVKVEEELLDLFFWDGAEFRLVDGQPPKKFYAGRFCSAALTCDVPQFLRALLERLAALRARAGTLPSPHDVLRLRDGAQLAAFRSAEARLLREFDGSRSAGDVVETSGLRRAVAWETVISALAGGVLERVAVDEASGVSGESARRDADALADALEGAADQDIVRTRLARALERAGDAAAASVHWRHLGDARREEGDDARALACYRECSRLAPSDFEARERVLDIHRRRGATDLLVRDGRVTAELLARHELFHRAKLLLRELVELAPADITLRRELVSALSALDERAAALEQLRRLVSLLERCGAPVNELLDTYARTLALDPRDAHARERVDELTGARAQRRTLRTTVAAAALILGICGIAFAYEAQARRELRGAYDEAERRLAAGATREARGAVEAVVRAYPLALATAEARDVARHIADRERDETGRLADAAARGEPTPEELSARNSAQRSEADRLVAAGRIEAAHAILRDVFAAGGPAARRLRVPLRLHVVPADALVELDGERRGAGAHVLLYDPLAGSRLRLSAAGFEAVEVALDRVLDLDLDVALPRPAAWTLRSDAAFDAAPVVAEGTVFVAGRDRRARALALADGTPLWDVPLGPYDDVAASPAVTGDAVVVAASRGVVHCLARADGRHLWRVAFGSPVRRTPLAFGGDDPVVVVAGDDGSLVALGVADGAPRWRRPAGTVGAESGIAAMDGATLACATPSGAVIVLEAARGTTVVAAADDGQVAGTPVYGANRLWAVARDGRVRAFSPTTGRAVREFPVPGGAARAPCVVGDVAYVAADDGTLIARRTDGGELFHTSLRGAPTAAPAVADGVAYVPAAGGVVHAVDAETGALRWSHGAGADVVATPVPAGEVLLVVTRDGRLLALRR